MNRSATCKSIVSAVWHEWANNAENRVSDTGWLIGGDRERWFRLPTFLDCEKLRPPEPEAVGSNPAVPEFSASSLTEKSLDFERTFEVESRIVAAQSYSDALITDHADEQMRRRGIDIDVVRSILINPEQVIEVRPGRVVLQSRVNIANLSQLVRVFIDVNQSPMRVVTVYRTSKIDKYWSRP